MDNLVSNFDVCGKNQQKQEMLTEWKDISEEQSSAAKFQLEIAKWQDVVEEQNSSVRVQPEFELRKDTEEQNSFVKVQPEIETIFVDTEHSSTSASRQAKDYELWSERTVFQPLNLDSDDDEESDAQINFLKDEK